MAEYAAPIWARSSHAQKLNPELNSACRAVTGCLKPINVEDLYLLAGIVLPDIRRDVCARVEKSKQETNEAHSLYGQNPAERRIESRNCFLRSVKPADFSPKVIRCSAWLRRLQAIPHRATVNIDESLAKGFDRPWTTWRCLNRLRTGWSPNASKTNIDKLQIVHKVQNTLRIATGCTHDTNTQHLHDETNVLPIHQHLELHASQIRQKAQPPTHPLHKLTIHPHTHRLKKQTTFNNINYIDTHPDTVTQQQISANSTQIHTSIVQTHLLISYQHKVDETHHPSPLCPLCKTHPHTTDHLFNCTHIYTSNSILDLWQGFSREIGLSDPSTAIRRRE